MREPAESGPSSGRFELGLTRTNEPVPAPIESIRTSGMFSRKRAMSGVWRDLEAPVGDQRDVERGAADVRAEHVVAFPSAARAPARPRRRRSGPETSVRASSCASIETVPPWAAITRSSKAAPLALGHLAHRLQRRARRLGGVGLDHRRVQPRQVAPHRVQLGGEEHRHRAVEPASPPSPRR